MRHKHTIHVASYLQQYGNRNRCKFPVQIRQYQLSGPRAAETEYYISSGISTTVSSTPWLPSIADTCSAKCDENYSMTLKNNQK